METYIARRPIIDPEHTTFAFRLHHRSSLGPSVGAGDPDHVASKTISDLAATLSLEEVTGGRKAFIETTRDTLINEYAKVLPKEFVVVHVPGHLELDPAVLASCEDLRASGYALAFDTTDEPDRWIHLADYLIHPSSAGGDAGLTPRLARAKGKTAIAMGIEEWSGFRRAVQLGYGYAEGSFLQRPVVVVGKELSGGRPRFLRILIEVHRPELDVNALEEIVKLDVSLSFKLLRYINSSHIGARSEIRSIRHALVLLGQRELKRWISLVAVTSMAEEKPAELISLAMTRARLSELLAPEVELGDRDQELFLSGILSVLDALLDRPLAAVLETVALSDDLREALLGSADTPLARAVRAVRNYTSGDWVSFEEDIERLAIDRELMPRLYLEAMQWSHQSLGGALAA